MKKNLWKLLGLAGMAGVAATGAIVVRNQRRRQAYTPDEVRTRLHERLAEAGPARR
jgi:hypothetical protein